MKGAKALRSRDYAVSEVIGGVILIVIAVVSFVVISPYLYPDEPDINIPAKIIGDVTREGEIILHHDGGPGLTDYNIFVSYPNGTSIGTGTVNDDNWIIGQHRYPFDIIQVSPIKLVTENEELYVVVHGIDEKGDAYAVFSGTLCGLTKVSSVESYYGDIILISSLRTNTSDEDLICIGTAVNTTIDPDTYIYNWLVNDVPLADVYLSFNTEDNSSSKDYSGNGNNATVNGASWNSQGVVGGSYYFKGSSDYITGPIPDVFNDVGNNDFTISLWAKSTDIATDWKVLMEGRYDNKNFVRIFQEGTNFNFAVTEDGTKYAVRTENLTSDTWYHITGIWDASEKYLAVYINGTCSTLTGNRNFPYGAQDGFNLGHGTAGSGGFFDGYIDEFQVFNRILSNEQIYQFYISTKDGESAKSTIVSEETLTGEIWECIVTPNDAVVDDTAVTSNPLQIIPYGGGS